jgi:hypoxanthine-guanine phosphoribosyltransferase
MANSEGTSGVDSSRFGIQKVLISADEIAARVAELGEAITRDYAGKRRC